MKFLMRARSTKARASVGVGIISSCLIFTLILSASEILSFLFATLYPHQFRPSSQGISNAIDFDAYRDIFLRYRYDAALGWQNPASRIDHITNCMGQKKTYTFDDRRARWSGPRNPVHILTLGDSYTKGAEVNDEETYPFWLHKLTGLGVANYGVSASGPLQAILQFEKIAGQHKEIRIAILGIMYNNLRRFPTRLYSVVSPLASPFLFKPYLDLANGEEVFRHNPNAPPAMTRTDLERLIEAAFSMDFFSKPSFAWPYSMSMIRLVNHRSFKHGVRNRVNLLLGRNVYAWFEDPDILRGLRYLIRRFNKSASDVGVIPVTTFIPASDAYLASPDNFIDTFDEKGALLINVGHAKIDWKRYNLHKSDGTHCHPSPYGYEMIARYISAKLNERNILQ